MNPAGLTDARFRALVAHATANGTRFVTRDELYTQACRPRRSRSVTVRLVVTAVVCLSAAATISSVLVLAVGVVFAAVAARAWFRPLLSRQDWDRSLRSWLSSGRQIDNLIEAPSLHRPPPTYDEPDIYEYGFERLLICDEDLTVDWLVKNGLHSQERTLILSAQGYPSYLVERATDALLRNPDLPIFLLHGTKPKGRALAERVHHIPWLDTTGRRVVDLGLHADDLKTLKLPRQQRDQASRNRLSAHAVPYAVLGAAIPLAMVEGVPLALAASHLSVDASCSFG